MMVCIIKKLFYLGIRMIVIFCCIVSIICECNKLYNIIYLNNQINMKQSLLSTKQIYNEDLQINNNLLYDHCFVLAMIDRIL